jgi:hypothetical protein
MSNIDQLWDDDNDDEDDPHHRWLLIWDKLGLECALNLDNMQSDQVLAALKEETLPDSIDLGDVLSRYRYRTRYNSHRNYEIYVASMPYYVGFDEIVEMFKSDVIKEIVRKKGIVILDQLTYKKGIM